MIAGLMKITELKNEKKKENPLPLQVPVRGKTSKKIGKPEILEERYKTETENFSHETNFE